MTVGAYSGRSAAAHSEQNLLVSEFSDWQDGQQIMWRECYRLRPVKNMTASTVSTLARDFCFCLQAGNLHETSERSSCRSSPVKVHPVIVWRVTTCRDPFVRFKWNCSTARSLMSVITTNLPLQ